MRRVALVCGFIGLGVSAVVAQGLKPFTLQQVLSAPYALDLTAAPVGSQFAWIENAEGVRNIWVGGPREAARMITPYSADDAQDINGMVWSDDAREIAYAYGAPSGENGKPANPAHLQRPTEVEVWVQPVAEGAKGIDLGPGHSPLFLRDGKSVLLVRAGQIWMVDVKQGEKSARRLVYDRGWASGMTLSPDGTLLAYESGRGGHSFIALFDLRTDVLRFVAPGTGRDFGPVFSPDGKEIAWLRGPFTEAEEFAANRVSAYPWSVMVADVATGKARAVFTPAANKPGSVLPRIATGEPKVLWMPDGRVVFYGEMDSWVHLYSAGLDGGAPVLLTPGKGEVESVAQGPGGALMWASNVPVCRGGVCDLKDEDRQHLWTLKDGKAVAATQGVGIETEPKFAADGAVAALVSSMTVPMHPVLVAKDGAEVMLRPGEWPAAYPMDAVAKQEPRQVLIPEADAARELAKGVAKDDVRVSLHGQLFLPVDAGGGKHAAIIFFHGGPMREMLLGYPAMEYYSNAYAMNQYLASRGFVVLSVNYHCGIGYGLDFRQCVDAGADGASEYADVLAAVRWLRVQKNVDAKRIGVWGGSYGGYLTAMALARNSDYFAAGVDFHGVHDWNLEDNRADWWQGSFAQKDVIAAKAKASSPVGDIAKWRSPVLLIHGDNDPSVAFDQTPMLADALRSRGVDVQELIFPDEVHEFLLHSDWLKAYGAEAAFFERVLKPEVIGSRK
jgi:dipeptidyl aminopeptidase/acylaminoacyl peptidase